MFSFGFGVGVFGALVGFGVFVGTGVLVGLGVVVGGSVSEETGVVSVVALVSEEDVVAAATEEEVADGSDVESLGRLSSVDEPDTSGPFRRPLVSFFAQADMAKMQMTKRMTVMNATRVLLNVDVCFFIWTVSP